MHEDYIKKTLNGKLKYLQFLEKENNQKKMICISIQNI